jgi:hypothetical protein
MSASSHSGIAASSIDKIDGIRYSDISSVSGTQRAASYFLDTYTGAKAAYSLRQLSSTATTAITVENSSGTTADIGFDSNGNLDTSALTTHCGSNYGRVSKWWDQSGNGNHMEQSTAASRPRIVDTSGNIVTTTDNSINALDFYGNSTARWLSDTFSSNNGDHFILSYVGEFRTVTAAQQIVSQWTSSTSTQTLQTSIMGAAQKLRTAARYSTASNDLGRADTTNTVAADTEYVVVSYISASPYTGDIDVNGDTATTLTGFPSTGNLRTASAGITIGRRHDNGAAQYQGYLSEMIIWSDTTLPDRDNIMTDTKSHYGIT